MGRPTRRSTCGRVDLLDMIEYRHGYIFHIDTTDRVLRQNDGDWKALTTFLIANVYRAYVSRAQRPRSQNSIYQPVRTHITRLWLL